jgi:hypothetical protein
MVEEHLVVTVRTGTPRDLAQIFRVARPEAKDHHAVIKAGAPAQRFTPCR